MKILFAAPFSGIRTSIFISSYYRALARVASTRGIDTRLVDTRELITQGSIPHAIRRLYVPLSPVIERFQLLSFTEFGLRRRLQHAISEYRPDILFCHAISAQSMDEVVRYAQRLGCRVVMWLGLSPAVVKSGILRLLRSLDCLFIYDAAYIPICRSIGCRRVELVPLGVDVDHIDAVPVDATASRLVDISFIGMIDRERYELLSSLAELDLGVWSWNYSEQEHSMIISCYRGEASGDETIRILRSSAISLNAHRAFEVSGGNYRLFEIPACCTLQLVDNKPDIARYFSIGDEVVVYTGPDDLKRKCRYYLEHPDDRTAIIQNARRRVLRDHTVQNRFSLMLDIMRSL